MSISTIESEAKTWLQAHERFLLVTFGILAIVFLGWYISDKYFDVAKTKATEAVQVLTSQQTENKKLEQNYQDLQKQQQAIIQQLQAQNTQLAQQSAAAYKAAAEQQAKDIQLTNQELADRIGELTNQQNIQSTTTGVNLDHDQSVGVTQTLDNIPALKQQVTDDQQIQTNLNTQITGLNQEVSSCNDLLAGQTKELADQKTSYEAQLKEAKALTLKSKFKYFGFGFITGLITGRTF